MPLNLLIVSSASVFVLLAAESLPPQGCVSATSDGQLKLGLEATCGQSDSASVGTLRETLDEAGFTLLAFLAAAAGIAAMKKRNSQNVASAFLASGGGDLSVRIWSSDGDVETGSWKEIAVLRGQHESITSVAWSPDGAMLLSASGDRSIVVWDPDKKKEMKRLLGHEDSITAATFFTCGRDVRILSASKDKTAIIWEQNEQSGDWQVMSNLKGHTDSLTSAAPAPDGAKVVTGAHDRTVRLWEQQGHGEWAQKEVLDGHSERVTSVAWSPDGQKIVSTSSDRVTRVWVKNSRGEWKANRLGLGSVTKAVAPGKQQSGPKIKQEKYSASRQGKNSVVDWGRGASNTQM